MTQNLKIIETFVVRECESCRKVSRQSVLTMPGSTSVAECPSCGWVEEV